MSPLPRFRDLVKYLQDPKIDLQKQFAKADKKELLKRIKYAKIWLKRYAPEAQKTGMLAPLVKIDLSQDQKKYLNLVAKLLQKDWQPQTLQQELYQTAKANGINPKAAFQAIYLALSGKTFGPQAAWFILDNKKEAIKRFQKVT